MTSLTDNSNAALQKAIWLLLAVALNAVELAIPRIPFLPWLKPGFANIITVLWIIRFGFTDALLYTALRIWISGFYFGFSLFTLSLSLSGGLLSTVAMSLLWMALGRRKLVGTVGMAVIGALFHNTGQLAVVYFVMLQNMSLLGQIPFMLGASIIFGTITGALVPVVHRIINLDGTDTSVNTGFINTNTRQTAKFTDKTIVALTFMASVSLMFVNNIYVLISAAIIFSLIPLILNPKKPLIILYPLKFYMLFIFIFLTYTLFSYGTRIDPLPFVTKEGLFASIKQTLRLWCWLQTTHIFKKFKFHEIFMSALRKFFPNKKDTLNAGMIALEHFPEVMRLSKSARKKIPVTALLFKPGTILSEYVKDIRGRIELIVNTKSP